MDKNSPFKKSGQYLYLWSVKLFLGLTMVWILPSCVPKVDLPVTDHFSIKSGEQSGQVDAGINSEQLISDLYLLMKANENMKILICEASPESKVCIDNGVSVYVQGGIIPGLGTRKYYIFSNILLIEERIEFTKNNSGTTFIATPMYCSDNTCHIYAGNGGLQVDMTNYYANWAGIGNMIFAEGWVIDYIDFEEGIVGLQFEMNILGYLVIGGGAKYALLKFPNVPDKLSPSRSEYVPVNKHQQPPTS